MSLKVRQNNQWVDVPEGLQWKESNEWKSGQSESEYVLVLSDWAPAGLGVVEYVGSNKYIIIPESIFGVSADRMRISPSNITEIQGVATTTNHLTSLNSSFSNLTSSKLDLRRMDVSNVTEFRQTFMDSNIGELDISSFDIPSSASIFFMFRNANIDVVYVKNSSIRNRLSSGSSASGIDFVVGSID